MTDEEKKAIEDLKEIIELYNDKCLITTEDDFKSIEILLNLIEKQSEEIEELKDEQEKEKQIKLKLQEKNIPIETLLAEFERLEDLEDDLTTVYLNGVYDGKKKVEDKIKAKIEELENEYTGCTTNVFSVLQSLLEKE